jgi:hypothetical protein
MRLLSASRQDDNLSALVDWLLTQWLTSHEARRPAGSGKKHPWSGKGFVNASGARGSDGGKGTLGYCPKCKSPYWNKPLSSLLRPADQGSVKRRTRKKEGIVTFARGLRIGLCVVVLSAALGWPFIWGPLEPDDAFFGRAAVELLMLWLAWWLFFRGPGKKAEK